jgi:AcrR family transcriptional regulator
MEKTRKKTRNTARKSATDSTEQQIRKAYREYVLHEGKQPTSVFKFAQELGMEEADFYNHFASFEALEKTIWKEYIDKTRKNLEKDSNYQGFTSREKILSFYYSLAEVFKSDRSFVLHQLKGWKNPSITPSFLKGFKSAFDAWITAVLNEGKQTGEVATRPYLDQRYSMLFWLHLMFILQFWSHDDSAGFEKTDMAIEKSVNLAFDLIGKGVLDNAIDFGKFLYQTSKN